MVRCPSDRPGAGRRHRRHQNGGRTRRPFRDAPRAQVQVPTPPRPTRPGRAGRPTQPERACCGAPWPTWCARYDSGWPADDRIVVCGVGCGGPMSPDGETVSPLNIGEWRDFPLRARLRELTGRADLRGQRCQGAGPGRGMDRRRRRAGATSSASSSRPASAVASSSMAVFSTDGWATPATSAMSSSCPKGATVSAVVGAVSRPRPRARRSLRSPGSRPTWPRRTWSSAPGPWSVAPWLRWSTCSISPWPS